MKRKILAMLLCVALTVALFGTLAVAAEENVTQPCTCATETDTHAEGCALYVAPKDETKDVTPGEATPQNVPVCNCESKDGTHAEACPCYVAPTTEEKPAHIEICTDDCTVEVCVCLCHLVKKIVASESLDQIWAIMDNMTEEQWNGLSEKQYEEIDNRIAALCVVVDDTPQPEISEPAVESEVIFPTVNFTKVAPFGAPVTG